jgi:hypothetical protein
VGERLKRLSFAGSLLLGRWSAAESGLSFSPSFPITTAYSLNALGALAGLQAGYLWQAGLIAFGPEFDIDVSTIGKKATANEAETCLICVPPSTSTFAEQAQASIQWLSTLRNACGRAGKQLAALCFWRARGCWGRRAIARCIWSSGKQVQHSARDSLPAEEWSTPLAKACGFAWSIYTRVCRASRLCQIRVHYRRQLTSSGPA